MSKNPNFWHLIPTLSFFKILVMSLFHFIDLHAQFQRNNQQSPRYLETDGLTDNGQGRFLWTLLNKLGVQNVNTVDSLYLEHCGIKKRNETKNYENLTNSHIWAHKTYLWCIVVFLKIDRLTNALILLLIFIVSLTLRSWSLLSGIRGPDEKKM